LKQNKEAGTFKPEMFQPFDKLQIVTVQQILDGARMNLPLMEEVTKKAKKAELKAEQGVFNLTGGEEPHGRDAVGQHPVTDR